MTTPLDRNLKLDVDSGTEECEPTHYHQLVGSMIYLTITLNNSIKEQSNNGLRRFD